jgi:hypothetical protein
MPEQKFALASGVDIKTANDAQSSIIAFKTKDGIVGVGLKNKELSKLAALLLERSEEVIVGRGEGEMGARFPSGRTALTLHPLRCSALGAGRGRTNDEVILAVEIGNLTLSFATDVVTLEGLCHTLGRLNQFEKPRRPN